MNTRGAAMFKAVILDFDGVILESVDVKGGVFAEVFYQYPQHLPEILAYHYANGGVSRFEKFNYIHREILKLPLPEAEFNALCRRFADLVVNRVLAVNFVAGAREFLEQYHERLDLFVVSGTPDDEIRAIVRARGLDRFFKGVYGSPVKTGVWTGKILGDGSYRYEEVVWVGDALSDWDAAREHGIRFIGRVYPAADVFGERTLWKKVPDLKTMDFILNESK